MTPETSPELSGPWQALGIQDGHEGWKLERVQGAHAGCHWVALPKRLTHSSHTSLASAGAHYSSGCPAHVAQPLVSAAAFPLSPRLSICSQTSRLLSSLNTKSSDKVELQGIRIIRNLCPSPGI